MLPCVTTLKYKGLETLDLEFKWCQRLGQDLQNSISGKDSFLGGGRGAREIDVDVNEGADNAVQRRISPPGILNILKISSPIGVNISEI